MLHEHKGNIHKTTRWATRQIYPSKELGVEVKEENLEEENIWLQVESWRDERPVLVRGTVIASAVCMRLICETFLYRWLKAYTYTSFAPYSSPCAHI